MGVNGGMSTSVVTGTGGAGRTMFSVVSCLGTGNNLAKIGAAGKFTRLDLSDTREGILVPDGSRCGEASNVNGIGLALGPSSRCGTAVNMVRGRVSTGSALSARRRVGVTRRGVHGSARRGNGGENDFDSFGLDRG